MTGAFSEDTEINATTESEILVLILSAISLKLLESTSSKVSKTRLRPSTVIDFFIDSSIRTPISLD